MSTKTEYRHVVEEGSDAFVEGTRISVAQLALTLGFGKKASESEIERIIALYPTGYLSPAKVHAALSYFYDNEEKVMRQLGSEPPQEYVKDSKGNPMYRTR